LNPSEVIALIIGFVGGGGLIGIISRIYNSGQRAGSLKTRIDQLEESMKSQHERITYIERKFMDNAPVIARSVRNRMSNREDIK
jgi:hypothetical protein